MSKLEYEYTVMKLITEAPILYHCMCQLTANDDGYDSQSLRPKGAFGQRLVKASPTEKKEAISSEMQLLVTDGGYKSGEDGQSQPCMGVLMVA